MKKIISMFLSLVMLISSFSSITAFAQEDLILTLDEPVYFQTQNSNESVFMYFDCEEDGYYSFNGKFIDTDLRNFYLYFYDENGINKKNAWIYNPKSVSSEDYIVVKLKAGCRYKLQASPYAICNGEVGLGVSKHEHTLVEKRSEPTCANTGYSYYSCQDVKCGYNSEKVILPTTDEHNYVYGVCRTCKKKDADYTDFKEYDALLNQTVSASVLMNEFAFFRFTPENDGYYQYKFKSSQGKALNMSLESEGSVTTVGSGIDYFKAGETYEFRAFNQYVDDTIEFTIKEHIHNFRISSKADPTCKSDGYITYFCNSCNYSYKDVLPMTPDDHQFVNGACKVCGKVDEDYVKVITELEENKDYSYTGQYGGEEYYFTYTVSQSGLYDFSCNTISGSSPTLQVYRSGKRIINGYAYKESYEFEKDDKIEITITVSKGTNGAFRFNKHIHTFSTSTVAPSCNSIGYTEHTCKNSKCGYSYIDDKKEPTGNHTFKTEVVKPTCVDFGATVYYCTKCEIGYACDYVAPDPTKHHFYYGICEYCYAYNAGTTSTQLVLGETVNITVPTRGVYVNYSPDETGWYIFKSNCTGDKDLFGELYDEFDNLIEYNDDISSSNYNFKFTAKLEKGKKYRLYIGSYEFNSVTASISLLKHNHSYSKTQAKATCGKKGYVKYSCSCGLHYYESVTPATGAHNWKTVESCKPNCKDEGYTLQQCSNCKQEREIDIVKPNGVHSYVDGICEFCEEIEPKASEFSLGVALGVNNLTFKEKNQIANLKFSPEKDGYYIINTSGYYDTYGVLLDKFGYDIISDNDSGLGNNFELCFYLVAGEQYTIQVRVLDEPTANLTLSISEHTHEYAEFTVPPSCGKNGSTLYTCKTCYYSYESSFVPATYEHNYANGFCQNCNELDPNLDSIALSVGANVKVSGSAIFSFVPQHSCVYTIRSNSKYDMSSAFFDEFLNRVEIAESNDDSSNDFIFNLKLSAGTKYYLVVEPSMDTEYSVSVSVHHNYKTTKTVKPTCNTQGYTEQICSECQAVKKINIIPATNEHKTETVLTKATTKANGKIVSRCKYCNKTFSTKVVYYPKTISLSATSYVYDGKEKKPTVKVVDSNGKTVSSSNYTVKYSSNKYVGKASVTITFKGNYSGSVTKYFYVKPKGTSVSKLTAQKGGFKVYWKKQSTQTTGYQIQYSTSSKFANPTTKTISKSSTVSASFTKLTKGKRYYVRVRTYKTVNGKNYYSSWSSYKYVTTKR